MSIDLRKIMREARRAVNRGRKTPEELVREDELFEQMLAESRPGEEKALVAEMETALDAEMERVAAQIVEYQDKIAEIRREYARQEFLVNERVARRRAENNREIHSLEQQIGQLVGDPKFADDSAETDLPPRSN
jgi:hypothetical protein